MLLYHSRYRALVELPVSRRNLLQNQTSIKHSLTTVQLILGRDPLPALHKLTSYWTLILVPVTAAQPASVRINHRWYLINRSLVVARGQCLTRLISALNRWLLGRLAMLLPPPARQLVEQEECSATLSTCLAAVTIPQAEWSLNLHSPTPNTYVLPAQM